MVKTSERIKQYLLKNQQASGSELADYLRLTDRAVRKQLASLLDKNEITKKGLPPKVFYQLAVAAIPVVGNSLSSKQTGIINANYLIITPSGEKMTGVNGWKKPPKITFWP